MKDSLRCPCVATVAHTGCVVESPEINGVLTCRLDRVRFGLPSASPSNMFFPHRGLFSSCEGLKRPQSEAIPLGFKATRGLKTLPSELTTVYTVIIKKPMSAGAVRQWKAREEILTRRNVHPASVHVTESDRISLLLFT